jgi:hypothetical protein
MKIIIAVSLAIFFNISNSFAMDLPDENLGEEVLGKLRALDIEITSARVKCTISDWDTSEKEQEILLLVGLLKIFRQDKKREKSFFEFARKIYRHEISFEWHNKVLEILKTLGENDHKAQEISQQLSPIAPPLKKSKPGLIRRILDFKNSPSINEASPLIEENSASPTHVHDYAGCDIVFARELLSLLNRYYDEINPNSSSNLSRY